jgi:hypothetical protein
LRLKGVCFDVGSVMYFNWRPHFDAKTVRREIEIIKNDLNCNAIRISGLDIKRLTVATDIALKQGLAVWFSPTMWNKKQDQTLEYIERAAESAERLRQGYPDDNLVFVVGGELTLFMNGILEGNNFRSRLTNPNMMTKVKAGEHNKPLNEFLKKANNAARTRYHGKVSYASLVWEQVDWDIFDYVGVDHYRAAKIGEKYGPMLEPAFKHGKPVVITEFGCATTHGGVGDVGILRSSAGLEESIINVNSQFLHQIPVFGRLVKPHLNGKHERDEDWQAKNLIETLEILDKVGVDGAFISGFESQITPYNDNPNYDLDMASSSLVKYYEGGKRGDAYPDMNWEPKQSFWAVAEYYSKS